MPLNLTPTKTYASVSNAERAIEKAGFQDTRYILVFNAEGRCYPIFAFRQGDFTAMDLGIHFHFCVLG